jgi:D-glycero-alpha-D-manno-heptose-7-phosphate kinase
VIISRTPFRISFFGGGSDYPEWYKEHGGAVLGTTINKYCYISIRNLPPFFEHRHRIVYSRIELTKAIEEIEHPAVRAVLSEHPVQGGLEIQHHGDLPARSGMGSSSSFTVGLLNAVRAFQGHMSLPQWLASEGIRIEQDVIGEKVGSQDQVWAAHGGTNLISFHSDGRIDVAPVMIGTERRAELESHLLLFFTGFARTANLIAAQKIPNLKHRTHQLNSMIQMVREASAILPNPRTPIRYLGAMFGEAWRLKKELADCIATCDVDRIYDAAIGAGALGGKLLGAGGGGFMLIFAEPSTHDRIREALRGLIEVSFQTGSPGSTIVVFEPDGLEEARRVTGASNYARVKKASANQ